MKDEGKRVCIIGHAPSTIGRGLGEVIDSYDVVIRMVECDWQNVEDYGKKYNIGIFTSGVSFQYARNSKRIPSDMYWYYLTSGNNLEQQWDSFGQYKNKGMITLRKTIWKYIQEKHYLSRGTASIIATVELLEFTEIALIGFDTVLRGIFSFDHHPDVLKNYIKRKPANNGNTHNWKVEKELIEQFIKNGVNIKVL